MYIFIHTYIYMNMCMRMFLPAVGEDTFTPLELDE